MLVASAAPVTLPFSADAFFDVFAAYNAQLWPVAVLPWAATAWTFVMVLRGRGDADRIRAGVPATCCRGRPRVSTSSHLRTALPTTILTIGFLIGAGPTFPRAAAVVPIVWSAIGGSASVLFGLWADVMMPVAAAGLLVDVCVLRPRWTSVRASAGERTRALPGDELIPACMGSFTHAITIHRRREDVWPWLVQMGAGSRAGWYSYDWLDNGRRPSAARIEPALQKVSVGTVFPALPGVTDCFTLLAFEPGRHLILGWSSADRGLLMTWAFVLERAAHGSTRLIVRARGGEEYRFQGLPPWLTKPIVRVVHAVMQRKQLLGIARRVEARRELEDAA